MTRQVKDSPLQLLIPFPPPLPPGALPLLAERAEKSLFSEACLWLKQDEIIVTYITFLPSLIFERYDKRGWDREVLRGYGKELFGGKPFREITLLTCAGTQKRRNIAELTGNMSQLNNFKELWREDNGTRLAEEGI